MKNIFSSCDWFLDSSVRCHVIGAIVSLTLLVATLWIWTNADSFAEDDRYTPEQIEEAIRLVAEAGQLRSKYADGMLVFNQNKRRISDIRRWLPAEPNWEQTNQRIRDIANHANVQLTSVDKADQHVGSRIGVQKIVCEMQGSYADICRLLNDLAADQKPIWCDSIRIQRTPPGFSSQIECSAVISMRVPFVTAGTVAAKLLRSEIPNAG